MQTSWRMNDITKSTNLCATDVGEMESGSFVGKDDIHNIGDFMEIHDIFVKQSRFASNWHYLTELG